MDGHLFEMHKSWISECTWQVQTDAEHGAVFSLSCFSFSLNSFIRVAGGILFKHHRSIYNLISIITLELTSVFQVNILFGNKLELK